VMIFPYVPGETEELISSTCAGKHELFEQNLTH
jgi:hypothetical protein